MAQDQSLQIKKSFGLNVIPSKRVQEEAGKSVENAIGNLWEPILGYLKENDKVFNGDVEKEIKRISLSAHKIGSVLAPDPMQKLDTKF